jgi:hypothetical protein
MGLTTGRVDANRVTTNLERPTDVNRRIVDFVQAT